METPWFDRWTTTLAPRASRRTALRKLIIGVGPLAALLAGIEIEEVAACRKSRKRCQRGGQCCSGHCQKRRCKGNAKPAVNVCLGRDIGANCGGTCLCLRTVEGVIACGDPASTIDCTADAECDAVSGPGSVCFFNKDGNGQCAAPCSNPS